MYSITGPCSGSDRREIRVADAQTDGKNFTRTRNKYEAEENVIFLIFQGDIQIG